MLQLFIRQVADGKDRVAGFKKDRFNGFPARDSQQSAQTLLGNQAYDFGDWLFVETTLHLDYLRKKFETTGEHSPGERCEGVSG